MGKADKKKGAPQADETTLVRAVAEAHHQSLALFPPPIAFYAKEKKDGAKAKKHDEKDDFKEIELKIDPTEKKGKPLRKTFAFSKPGLLRSGSGGESNSMRLHVMHPSRPLRQKRKPP